MNKTYSDPYRLQQRFWLDITRPLEHELAHYIDDLKRRRSFTSTIRDALRLIKDLRQGSIRVLLLLFPWVWDQVEAEVRASIAEPRHAELHPALEAHMARLEKLLAERERSAIPVDMPVPKTLTTGQPRFSAAEEPSLEIKTAAGDGKRATQNFMRSLMAIQTSYKTDEKPVEVLKKSPAVTSTGTGNPKKMEVSPLETPAFDTDLDDLTDLMAVTKT